MDTELQQLIERVQHARDLRTEAEQQLCKTIVLSRRYRSVYLAAVYIYGKEWDAIRSAPGESQPNQTPRP